MQGINRTLLSWLKLWDEVVFGRPIATKSRPNGAPSTNTGHKGQEDVSIKKSQQGRKAEVTFEYHNPGAFSGSEVMSKYCCWNAHSSRFTLYNHCTRRWMKLEGLKLRYVLKYCLTNWLAGSH